MARLVRAIHDPLTVWMARMVASDSVATGHDELGYCLSLMHAQKPPLSH